MFFFLSFNVARAMNGKGEIELTPSAIPKKNG